MFAKTFYFGVLLVDDDPDIIDQHKFLLGNRAFRRQTPGRLYVMLRDAGLIEGVDSLDKKVDAGRWPTKKELEGILEINPEIDDPFTIVEPDVAYSADEAVEIWQDQKSHYLAAGTLGYYVAILDHDMPVRSGLELAEEWRPLIGSVGPGRVLQESPMIMFYTGKAPLLQAALSDEGYATGLDGISATGLAEAILLKGALRDEFNQLMWGILEKRVKELAG